MANPRKFKAHVDLLGNELRNSVLQNLSTAPSTPAAGQMYYDTDDNKPYIYNGSGWVGYGGDIETITAGSTKVSVTNGTGPSVAIDVDPTNITHTDLQDIGTNTHAQIDTHIASTSNPHSVTLEQARTGSNSLSGDIDANGNTVVNLATPSNAGDAASKAYVDAQLVGIDPKDPVHAAIDSNIDISSALVNGASLGGVTVATGRRYLLFAQTDPSQNGIYDAVASGAASRSADSNTSAEVTYGLRTFVVAGDYAGQIAVLVTTGAITLDTTDLSFSVSTYGNYIAGDGIDLTSGEIAADVSDFVGTGLEDDGSNNIRIAAAAAGDGLQGGAGSALAVDVSDFAGTGLEDDGSENLRLAAQGNGIAGGEGSTLSVSADSTGGANLATVVNVSANGVAVKIDDTTVGENGTNQLEVKDNSIDENKLTTSVAGDGLSGGDGTALSVVSASTTTAGRVELATATEAQARSDAQRAVTPASLADFVRKKASDFITTDFTAGVLLVTAGSHGVGANKNLMVSVYEDGSPNEMVDCAITVADNGDVTIETETAFNGHYVIIG